MGHFEDSRHDSAERHDGTLHGNETSAFLVSSSGNTVTGCDFAVISGCAEATVHNLLPLHDWQICQNANSRNSAIINHALAAEGARLVARIIARHRSTIP